MPLHTSITITPPHPVQALAVPLLRRYAYDLPRRLPAHITVLYPFVAPGTLDTATETLRALCADIPPFPLTVAGYGQFPGVAYLAVAASAPLDELQAKVQAAFPDCTPYEGAFGGDAPPPHITVGVFNSAAKQARATLPPYPPQTFTVDRLTVSIGDPQRIVPWLVRAVVQLNGAAVKRG